MFTTKNQNFSGPFTRKDIRSQFITKVFSITGIQLFTTALIIILIRTNQNLVLLTNYISIPFAIAGIISLIALTCSKNLQRKVPTNYLLLSIITFSESLLLEVFLRAYHLDAILVSVLVTGFTIALMGMIAMNSNIEFMGSKYFTYLLLGHLVFLLFSMFFFRFDHVVYSIASAVVTCVYIIVDIQIIMGDKSRKLEIDDYIMGSLFLYLDILQLFKNLVEILGDKDDKKKKNRR